MESTSEFGQKVSFSQNNYNKGGRSHINQPFGGGSMFTLRGGSSLPRYRLVILCLGLLNAILLVAAIVIGIYCNKVHEGYMSEQSIATPLIIELNYLQGNHSNIIEALEEAQKALETEKSSHQEIQLHVEQQKTLNDGLQDQIESLRGERTNLKSNISAIEESCGHCLPDWVFLNSTCYLFSIPDFHSKKNWPDSRADCISRGADLLVIDNWEEQQLITDNFPRVTTSGVWWSNGFWMGLTDIEVEGTWVWVNNITQEEPLYWIDGEPNNHGEQGENCGAFYARSDARKTWYDGKCHHHQYNWICEMKPRQS
ncbi:uncharacterized protein ACJ7VT_007224 [Polymixia lowei]